MLGAGGAAPGLARAARGQGGGSSGREAVAFRSPASRPAVGRRRSTSSHGLCRLWCARAQPGLGLGQPPGCELGGRSCIPPPLAPRNKTPLHHHQLLTPKTGSTANRQADDLKARLPASHRRRRSPLLTLPAYLGLGLLRTAMRLAAAFVGVVVGLLSSASGGGCGASIFGSLLACTSTISWQGRLNLCDVACPPWSWPDRIAPPGCCVMIGLAWAWWWGGGRAGWATEQTNQQGCVFVLVLVGRMRCLLRTAEGWRKSLLAQGVSLQCCPFVCTHPAPHPHPHTAPPARPPAPRPSSPSAGIGARAADVLIFGGRAATGRHWRRGLRHGRTATAGGQVEVQRGGGDGDGEAIEVARAAAANALLAYGRGVLGVGGVLTCHCSAVGWLGVHV